MLHIMIVQSPYYEEIAGNLLKGALAALEKVGATCEIFQVAGALEIPSAILMGADSNKFGAYLALGCVIRGETSHYDIVCNESARGLMELSIYKGLMIGNAILTCDTMEQAIVRADPAQKNKGADAVEAIVSLYDVRKSLNGAE